MNKIFNKFIPTASVTHTEVNLWRELRCLKDCTLSSYLTETQMMMIKNKAKKNDSRTPRMICSSLVSSPSAEAGRDRTSAKSSWCMTPIVLYEFMQFHFL